MSRSLRLLLVAGFLGNFHLIGGILIPFFTQWGGISESQVFFLQALFMICLWLFEVPTGFVADKYGRKTSVAFGTLISAVGFFMYGVKPELWLFAVCEITIALGTSLVSGADKALIQTIVRSGNLENTDEQATKFYQQYRLGKMIALMIASLIGSQIAGKYGLSIPTQLMTIPLLISALLMLLVPEPRNGTKEGEKEKVHPLAGFRILRANPDLTIVALDKAVVHAAGVVGVWLYQGLLLEVGVRASEFGFVHGAVIGLEVVLIAGADYWLKLTAGRKNLLTITGAIPILGFGVGVIAQLLPSGIWAQGLAVAMPILAIGFGLGREPYFFMVENLGLDDKTRATALSTIQMFTQAGIVLMYLVVGVGVEAHRVLVFLILGVVLLVWRLVARLPARADA